MIHRLENVIVFSETKLIADLMFLVSRVHDLILLISDT